MNTLIFLNVRYRRITSVFFLLFLGSCSAFTVVDRKNSDSKQAVVLVDPWDLSSASDELAAAHCKKFRANAVFNRKIKGCIFCNPEKDQYFYDCVQDVNLQNSQIKNSSQPNVVVSTSLEEAKKKCSDLGFKSGTEGFGKCVLQLSK